jgi:gliding motility-associated-like protein
MKDLSRHFVYAPADIINTRNNPDRAQKGFYAPVPLPYGRLRTIKFIAFFTVVVFFCATTVNQTFAGHSSVNGSGLHHFLNTVSDRAGGNDFLPQNMPPVALCRNITVSLGPSGTVTVNPSQVDAGSFDPDGSVISRVINPNTFSCLNIGANTVELIVTDNGGLTSTCNATVIVQDNIAPQMACRNITVYLDKTGSAPLMPADLDNGSTDNCAGSLMLYLNRTELNCSDIGAPVTITLTGTDAAGNSSSCISQITVLDTIAPVVNLKRFNLVLGENGTGTVLPSDIDNGSFDNCGALTLSVAPNTFTCGDVGSQEVVLTATDAYGNSRSRKVTITVSSSLKIIGTTLNSCELAVPFALYSAQIEGGDGDYSYFWKGMEESSLPFLVFIPPLLPPYIPILEYYNTSTERYPLFNSTNFLPDGSYNIRLVVTDGNGCTDTSFMIINKAGPVFNNITLNTSDACEGDIRTYSVIWNDKATYQWNVVNGTILNADQDTSSISVLWDLGVIQGVVETTTQKPSQESEICEYYVTETVTIHPVPAPSFISPPGDACSNTEYTYSLTGVYAFHNWTVTGGNITGGGSTSDNFVTIRWGSGPAGNITVTVESAEGCTSAIINNILINNLSGSVSSLTDITCNGISDGQVTVAAAPGSGQPPYEYSLDGGAFQASGTFTNITLGNHVVRIRDGLLCVFDVPFTITQPTVLMGSVGSQTDVNCFGGSDGSLTISALGGTPPYEYSLNGGLYQASNIFTGLPAGLYTVTIRDNNNCLRDVQAQVTEPFAALAASAMAGNVLCYGDETGSVILTVTGGTTPYSYLWSNGAATKDITNLSAGTYTVLITDANGCTASAGGTVTQPAAPLEGTITVTDVLCYGEATGSVNLTVSGGTPTYTFLWSNGSITEDLSDVTEGTYTVTVTDANGCTLIVSETVTQPDAPLTGTVTITNVSCFGGNDGAVDLVVTGGTQPYAFAWSNGAVTEDISGLTAGTYSVIITDQNSCVTTVIVTVTQPAAPLSGTSLVTNVLCFGEATGAIDLTVTGGTTPYSYLWSNGSVLQDLTNVTAGTYSVTITDANGCTAVVSATITQPAAPLAGTTTITNILCFGDPTGAVDLEVTGGTLPYTFLWNNGATSEDLTNLIAGTYTVTVTDANGCTLALSAVVAQPAAGLTGSTTVSNVNCFGGNDGAVNLTVTGGTLPYSFAWSNGAISEDINGLLPGTYSVIITDQNGCSATVSATVTQPSSPLSVTSTVTNVLCNGEATGVIDLTVAGGTTPYTFLWSDGSTEEDLSGVAAGSYSVIITDANGCTTTTSGTIAQPPEALTGSITSQTNVSVYGGNDGSVSVAGLGGIPPYQYRIGSGLYQASGIFGSLVAGSYVITVQDDNLCTFEVPVTITQPLPPFSGTILSQTNVLCFGGNNGSATAEGIGGLPPYEYSLDSGPYQASGTFLSLIAGTYTITIRDAASDTYTVPLVITEPAELTAVATGTDALCAGQASGTATVVVMGGTEPWSYSWNTTPVQTGASAVNLTAGLYTVTVTDANGCETSADVTIEEPPDAMLVTITRTNVRCYGSADGTAEAVVSGGAEPYAFSWNTLPVQTTATATGLDAGNYTVTITDANGCVSTGSVQINEPDLLVIQSVANDATCPDEANGSIVLTITGGTELYTIIWSDGAGMQNRINMLPGTYSVVVTDQNGCSQSHSVTVGFIGGYNCVEISNIITPNSDGFNDEWILKNIDLYPDAEVLVFNRWGKLVFRTKNISANPWDGTSEGKLVPTDSYHYILYLNDGSEPKRGVISVIR